MRLPAPLAPWAAQLAVFPSEVALALGPAVRRLAAAVGGWPGHPEGDRGEPDGFDGLTHRGSYERLLTSEWLFADLWPEEFLRRAAMGEHTFLRLARPQPAAARHSVVLFDAGPSQLGTPRIAHVAALVVLARRAAVARANFSWGILQQPPASDGAEITPKSLRGLLNARSAEEPTEAALAAWHVHIDRHWHAGDVWIVGPPRWERLAAACAWSSLAVRDVYDLGLRVLDVSVKGPKRGAARVTLELPPPDLCTRLLRNPTGEARTPGAARGPVPLAHARDVVFALNGQRLIARAEDGRVVVYVVPTSARDKPTVPILVPASPGTVVSVDHRGRRLVIVRQQEGELYVEESTKKGGRMLRASGYVPQGAWEAAAPEAPLGHFIPHDDGFLVRDASGGLRRLTTQDAARVSLPVADHVAAVALAPSGVAYVERRAADGWWRLIVLGASGRQSLALVRAESFAAHIGRSRRQVGTFPPVAGSEDGQLFRLWYTGQVSEITVSGHVLGVFSAPDGRCGLVVLQARPARLLLAGPNWVHPLPAPPPATRPLAFCAATGRIAFLTDRGELSVFSIPLGEILGRWRAD